MLSWRKHSKTNENKVKSFSHVQLFATPWTIAHQAPPSMGFSRQEDWSGLTFPSPGHLPDPGTELGSPALQADSLLSEPPGKTYCISYVYLHRYKFIEKFLDEIQLKLSQECCFRRGLGVEWKEGWLYVSSCTFCTLWIIVMIKMPLYVICIIKNKFTG